MLAAGGQLPANGRGSKGAGCSGVSAIAVHQLEEGGDFPSSLDRVGGPSLACPLRYCKGKRRMSRMAEQARGLVTGTLPDGYGSRLPRAQSRIGGRPHGVRLDTPMLTPQAEYRCFSQGPGATARRPFPHLAQVQAQVPQAHVPQAHVPQAQCVPSPQAAALLAMSPQLVTRGSAPPAGLRPAICQAFASTPSLREPGPVFRSRSYAPHPMRQSTTPAHVCVAQPVRSASPCPTRRMPSKLHSSCLSSACEGHSRGCSPHHEGRESRTGSPRNPSTGAAARSVAEGGAAARSATPTRPEGRPEKYTAGTEVCVAGLRVRCKAVLGRGSFSEVWAGEVMGTSHELALKDIICKTKADLDQALLEASLLERFQPMASGPVPVMRIPRYLGHRVDTCGDGWRVCLAMSRVPGECLDNWLKKQSPLNQEDGPSSVRRGCALAMALIRQLGPTLELISPHVWHRDVNSHNILISDVDGSRLASCDEEDIFNRASFWLIDFGLAVESKTWPQRWPSSDVAGDCRYWAPSSFVMSFCGPEETAANQDFCSQYKTKLDIVGLGLTALELLCSTCLSSRKTWGPDGLRGSWERLLDTWERYREDVTRWHAMIFQVFTKGADVAPLYRKLGQERVVERVISHIAEVRKCLRACVNRAEDPAIQRLLTVLAETIDEKSTSDMRQVLEQLDPPRVISRAADHSGKLQWSAPREASASPQKERKARPPAAILASAGPMGPRSLSRASLASLKLWACSSPFDPWPTEFALAGEEVIWTGLQLSDVHQAHEFN
ncbi:unnamed protein product [Effrenium voratum]|nr:unnamed protein product [Effrenium voratum]